MVKAVDRRVSRWASPEDKAQQPPITNADGTALPSLIEGKMTAEQLEAYVAHFRIQEITNQLQLPDTDLQAYVRRRAPSPDPEYDSTGRRTNTRSQRHRSGLKTERHRFIEEITANTSSYKPPFDYRRPTRFTDRINIPQTDFPAINFIGQILGPRGSTLKGMETASGATISIRGKESVKEGRGRKITRASNNAPLHVVILADSQSKVEDGKKRVQKVIDDAAFTPECKNEHKKSQLRDLAKLNGTFRDDESQLDQQGQRQIAIYPCLLERTSTELQHHSAISPGTFFDKEYEQLMQDINASSSTNDVAVIRQRLPPWRVDRLRQKGHY